MDKKILFIGILVIAVVLLGGCIHRPKPTTTTTTISTKCSNQICESNENGNNCPEDCCVSGDGICRYGCAYENDDDCEVGDLSQVKLASQYRYVTDGIALGRSLDEVIKIFKETKTDFIFQGWLTQLPCPDKCSDLPSKKERSKCEQRGYSYEHLRNATSEIKKEIPDVIFSGGIQAEFLYPDDVPGKDEKERRDKAWEMALNPRKWGIDFSKRDMQCYWAKRWGVVPKTAECPDEEELKLDMEYYFPDLTNPKFQEIFLNRIYKQIDAGADAIWIDMLYAQANLFKLKEMPEVDVDESHSFVQDSHKAASEIVERIHEYGLKKDRYIYVVTWVAVERYDSIILLHPNPNVDAAMTSPSSNEIFDRSTKMVGDFDEKRWDEMLATLKPFGIPIFARIDYGGIIRTNMRVFSQELTKEQAREFLIKADDFFQKKGIIFIYPIHGGDMGQPASEMKKLSYGKFNWYDSLAPEFQTYETIKELSLNKTTHEGSYQILKR